MELKRLKDCVPEFGGAKLDEGGGDVLPCGQGEPFQELGFGEDVQVFISDQVQWDIFVGGDAQWEVGELGVADVCVYEVCWGGVQVCVKDFPSF